MLTALTGMGLAVSSGLSVYIPLLLLGALSRYSDLVDLPQAWMWLEEPWVLAVLAVLFLIDFVADKVPVVDHINDVIQTLVRPTSGGIAFGATTTSDAVIVNSADDLFAHRRWVPIAAGLVIALVVHVAKAVARYAVNAATFGAGSPVISAIEDVSAVTLALIALLAPVLVVGALVVLVTIFVSTVRRRRSRRRTSPVS